MKRISTAMILIGLMMLIIALNSDVAVDTYGRKRVSNMGLMHEQLINTILSISLMMGGLLIKIFGKHMGDVGYLQFIDQLPKGELLARLMTAVLATACGWILVVMYFWPTMTAGVLLFAGFTYACFLPQATYPVIKKVWLGVMLLATGTLIWHGIAITTAWINRLTIGLFSDGVYLIDSGRMVVVVGTLGVAPWLLSIVGFVFATVKAKRA